MKIEYILILQTGWGWERCGGKENNCYKNSSWKSFLTIFISL